MGLEWQVQRAIISAWGPWRWDRGRDQIPFNNVILQGGALCQWEDIGNVLHTRIWIIIAWSDWFFFSFIFWCSKKLVGSQFLDQVSNPGHGSDSAESSPLSHQWTPQTCFLFHIWSLFFSCAFSLGTPIRWRLWHRLWTRFTAQEETAQEPNHFHSRAAWRTGTGFWKNSLSWYLH